MIKNKTILVFNGEIYNYLDLKSELKALGMGPFVSDSDTEIVSYAYQAWGLDCFKKFNGFWAIALLDLNRNIAVLSRDRFGKKPLYYHKTENGDLYFASTIKALLHARKKTNNKLSICNDSVFLYLAYDRRNTLKSCFWSEIELISSSNARVIDLETGKFDDYKYWSLNQNRKSTGDISLNDATHDFREIFDDSVRLRLRSDVPIAASLSGGLDSSSIVASAQKYLGVGSRLLTCNVRYNDTPELDESYLASVVSEHTGTKHQTLTLSSSEVWEHIDHLVDVLEEPVHSLAFMTQWLGWKATQEQGAKVILLAQLLMKYFLDTLTSQI